MVLSQFEGLYGLFSGSVCADGGLLCRVLYRVSGALAELGAVEVNTSASRSAPVCHGHVAREPYFAGGRNGNFRFGTCLSGEGQLAIRHATSGTPPAVRLFVF